MGYNYKPIQKKTLPTIEEALIAYSKAMKPDDKERDVRPLLAIEEQLPEADPRLDGHISARTAALGGFEWRVVARNVEDAASATTAQEVQTRITEAVDEMIERHLDAVMFGHSVSKTIWTLQDKWTPTVEEFIDASDLEPMKDAVAFPGRIAFLQADPTGEKFTRVPLTNTTDVSYITERWGRGIGGIMKKIMFYQILLHMNVQDWQNFNNRLKGLALSTYKEGSDAGAIDTAKTAVTSVGSSNAAVISDDVEFEFVKMVDGIGKDSYEQFMERLDARIEMAFRGQANTAELPEHGGSRAAIQTSHLVEIDLLWSDLQRFTRKMNRQLLRQDYERNVSPLVPPMLPYKFEFITDETEDSESNARTLETLVRAGFIPDVEEVKKRTGWSTLTLKASTGLL